MPRWFSLDLTGLTILVRSSWPLQLCKLGLWVPEFPPKALRCAKVGVQSEIQTRLSGESRYLLWEQRPVSQLLGEHLSVYGTKQGGKYRNKKLTSSVHEQQSHVSELQWPRRDHLSGPGSWPVLRSVLAPVLISGEKSRRRCDRSV